ncbi:MAG TPA: multicopper oxidase domain-containing protein [Anaeromyxobacter sp.]|nr:multicopper oxidase domain-containing protein [Anaeromyxobacter sp.]
MRELRTPLLRCTTLLLLPAAWAIAPAPAAAQAVGVACTTAPGPNPTFTLRVSDGYIQLPDGNTMYMWGYAPAGGGFQHPGPTLCVTAGQTVTVVLQNPSPRPVSIVFPGQEGVTADGALAQPQLDTGGTLTSLAQAAPPGGSVTYSFVAARPGTFPYHSGTDPLTQVRMGLFGALVVRPGVPERAFDRPDSAYTAGEEFMLLLSEIDPLQHYAVEGGLPFDPTTYKPRYWLANGRGFPDTIADNGVPWLPTQPYGALARIHPWSPATHPLPGVVRYLNFGSENYPFHPHGNNGLVVGRDGFALEGPLGEDLAFEKFAINVAPGQTWDVLFQWHDAESYSPGNPVPVTVPSVANLQYGMFYGGSPYLGSTGPLPPGASTLNQCGEYYIITHNHALHQLSAWGGVVMVGPLTYLRIDPPQPNSCP